MDRENGPTAALKTLDVMERTQSWKFITEHGLYLREKIEALANKYDIDITLRTPALINFTLKIIIKNIKH